MPGQFQFSVDRAMETVRRWADLGLRSVLLFGITEPGEKDECGSQAWQDDAPVQVLAREIKKALPEMLVIADTCLCEYTSHGHCGPLQSKPSLADATDVDNEKTLDLLRTVALSQASAGVDIVAPSGMMDGQVATIRNALDGGDFSNVAILSYAVKFASSYYGPFRDAAESPPQSGDRRTHQMDFRASQQIALEVETDVAEGADMLMVKPAATYLDVISSVRQQSALPLAAYHVSGEYAQIIAAAQNGWLDEQACAVEITTAIKRAGADCIITYFAEKLATWLQ